MAARHRFALRLAALSLLGSLVASCGGGDSSEPPCEKPGTLRALAIQGDPAPGTAGDYGPFAAAGLAMDTAPNGWSVFVATTTDVAIPTGLFVARPDGVVLLVWAQGELVPDAQGGTISGFELQPLEVSSDGRILCRVNIAGDLGGRTFGLLSARVDGPGGAVIEKNDVVYAGRDMAPDVAGTLTAIFGATTFQADDGKVFFHGETSTGIEAFWRADADGTNVTALVYETQTLPGGDTLVELEKTGISTLGTHYAIVVERSGGLGEALYSTAPGGALSFLAGDGQALTPLTGGGTIIDTWEDGPLVVYESGAVVWQGVGSQAPPDDILFLNAPGLTGQVLARSGNAAAQTGGSDLTTINLLNCARDVAAPMFRTILSGGPNDGAFAIFAVTAIGSPPLPVVGQGTLAPGSAGGGTVTDAFAGLSVSGRDDVSRNGALVFANLLSTGKSGLFWLIPNCGFFTVAVQDTPAPGGDTFGVFYPSSAHTTADGSVLFRGLLNTAGSGLFRQGP